MTIAELEQAVLRELGVLAAGESANADDAAIVDAKYAALYEMLLTEGLVTWAAADDLPSFAEWPVTLMVAYLCADEFGVPPDKKMRLEKGGALNLLPINGGPSEAERILRRQLSRNFVYTPAVTDYF